MEEKHFSEHIDEHVEFLPVEWRSKLSLDGGGCGVFKAMPAYTFVYYSGTRVVGTCCIHAKWIHLCFFHLR